MPLRYAHWVLLGVLAPLVLIAFWPAYWGDLPHASLAFHIHGLTASAWLLLVAAQSRTIHARRRILHRAMGLAVFVAVPLFAAGGALALHSMAVKYATASHPFYAVFGPRLGLHDIVSTTALVAMVAAALRQRRHVARHARYMVATVLLVLPPIMARLPLPVPPALHPGELVATGIALKLFATARRDGRPFLIVAGVMALEVILFETVGASQQWARAFAVIAAMRPEPLALGAMGAAAVVLVLAWQPPRRAASAGLHRAEAATARPLPPMRQGR